MPSIIYIFFFLALSFNLGAKEESLNPNEIVKKLKELEIVGDDFDPSNEEHLNKVQAIIKDKLIKGDKKLIKELSTILPKLHSGKSEDLIKQNTLDSLKEGKLKSFLEKYPKLLTFYARLIKDERAFVGLTGIMTQRDKLSFFGIFILVSIALNYMVKKVIKTMFKQITRVCFFLVLRIGVFYYIFQNELSPSVKIFRDVFLV
ncbi:MAG: hypothetical protein ACO20H_11680 [Bacteriovoracaceae bacterium]